jgi:hypothetical protein
MVQLADEAKGNPLANRKMRQIDDYKLGYCRASTNAFEKENSS